MSNIQARPDIRFIPMSTDEDKIRFFGTLMPALLLLKQSPARFLQFQIALRSTPSRDIASFIAAEVDDAARVDDTIIFVHRWLSTDFDPFTFARAKTFLARVTRMVRRVGYVANPLDPLSPRINLPKLAAQVGLGNLSPYGLLVHPIFGPRLILTGLKTDMPLAISPRWGEPGCDDCMACVKLCPQEPLQSGVIDLKKCQTCARCLTVCPTGKGRRAQNAMGQSRAR
jgi:epoxyqueuosine reductase